MKPQTAVRLSLIVGLVGLTSTVCGAENISIKPAPSTAPEAIKITTPEMVAASDRVRQSETQLETARKQLVAARSLLKAAEADLKAARAEREALMLRTQAQGLAEESGMVHGSAPVSLAARPATPPSTIPSQPASAAPPAAPVPAASAAPAAPAAENNQGRIQQLDFNAEPLPETGEPAPQIQLR